MPSLYVRGRFARLTPCMLGAMIAAWLLIAPPTAAGEPRAADLIGHWPLAVDARDVSPHGRHGQADGVQFAAAPAASEDETRGPGAEFDGRRGQVRIDLPPAATNNVRADLGRGEFTICARVRLRDAWDDVSGDVLSLWNDESQRGVTLSVVTNAAATSSQANLRQVQFGLGAGPAQPTWQDCGRPGQAVLVFGLCAFDGQLFAATCESGADQAGHVYRYVGGHEWIDCGSPDRANAVSALAEFDGHLYAATACYRLRGSALTDSPNQTPGGGVFRYDGDGRWTACGKLGTAEALNGLVVYRGRLYASSTYSPGVFRYEGGTNWTDIGTPDGRRVEALSVFDGALYGGGYDAGEVYRYTPEVGWQTVARLEGNTQTYGFAVYAGKLHVGTWPSGEVYRNDDDGQWRSCGRLGEEKEVMPVVVFNGQLLGGTLPLAQVYRYAGGDGWRNLGQLDATPDVTYRRVWCMAGYGGRLFAGTLPSGHIYSADLGPCVTSDRSLPGGWRHLAGVRSGGELRLYVDGKLAGVSPPFDATLDVSGDGPLWLGRGPYDHFHGTLRDVRLYRAALTAEEIAELAER